MIFVYHGTPGVRGGPVNNLVGANYGANYCFLVNNLAIGPIWTKIGLDNLEVVLSNNQPGGTHNMLMKSIFGDVAESHLASQL